jgi:hypothetical protein
MRTYAFRITCTLADGDIKTDEHETPLALPPPAQPIQVFLSKRENETRNWFLTLWYGSFNSEAQARAAGAPVKKALMLAGVILGVGIDVADDHVVSPAFRRADGQADERLQPDVYGLQVVPEMEGMLFGSLEVGPPVRRISPAAFEKSVAKSYAFDKLLTRKQILAAQLYNQSHFLVKSGPCWITSTGARSGCGARQAACARRDRDRVLRGSRAAVAVPLRMRNAV